MIPALLGLKVGLDLHFAPMIESLNSRLKKTIVKTFSLITQKQDAQPLYAANFRAIWR